ncbi:LacI family DNA-binding transcriptional regulator [Mesonia mobilis]|uniref:LacI family DNA-binding transcriptional regulator n=1 Tax=Mesonia mobilis TaxID=369791 RepID=UPI0024B928CD|nr:LacI family DNA-binding transcriptional regulator [Mesonia mobilis]
MKNKKISIKDIASELGVSVTTVSFVLNNKAEEKRISKEVTKKVLAYVEKVNYKPNSLAQSLRTGKSKVLVCMLEDISNDFFAKLARHIEDIAYQKGYKILFCSNDNDDEKSIELIDLFLERQVDGFLLTPSPNLQPKILELEKRNIPVVLLDRFFEKENFNYVGIDNEEASKLGVEHLLENNYNKIGFISIDMNQTQMNARLLGFDEAINKHQLYAQKLILKAKDSSEEKINQIKLFLNDHSDLDSILFSTNYLTFLGLKALKENDPKRLNELGIISFDDNSFFEICKPSITTLKQPLDKIAKEAMRIMFKNLDSNSTVNAEMINLKTELKLRESTQLFNNN